MSSRTDRAWMYKRLDGEGYLSDAYSDALKGFLDFAFSNKEYVERKTIGNDIVLRIRCPCRKCKNRHYTIRDDVELHLLQHGFVLDYWTWWAHGETNATYPHVGQCSSLIEDDGVDGCTQMVLDNLNAARSFHRTLEEQSPNESAQEFYDMLADADVPLWNGCKKYSKLQAATRLLNWKSEFNIPESAYNRLLPIIQDMLPDGHQLVGNFYETKKALKKLGLPKEKIDACKNHCMLFYKDDSCLTNCRVCGESRYKIGQNHVPNLVLTYMPIVPRLQRLYMYNKTAKEMTWHYDHQTKSGKMVHPSDGEAWKHFDSADPNFAEEIRNVRLGLCTDGFSPNNSNSTPCSLWPVFLTIYNLPPWMALKDSYVKVAMVIPGKKSPGQNLDVFLRPLIDELKMLYAQGVVTYDAYRKNNFTMRAILLWTVSDFPAYAMLSGWSTHGKLACPYCMGRSGSFQLRNGGKSCWFDCHRKHLPQTHSFRRDKMRFLRQTIVTSGPPPLLNGDEIWEQVRHLPTVYDGVSYRPKKGKPAGFGVTHNWVKRSIFWELPYWRTLLIRHNLDVMHNEKNVFDNLFNTIMDTPKTKDNLKARLDVELYCNRPHLHTTKVGNKIKKPKALYTLTKPQVKNVCEWLKKLKFPDGYASNIGACVNLEDNSFYSFKSHDCHVFMQRLLPIALRGMIPNLIWDTITELCTFFHIICSKVLHTDDLIPLQSRIVEIICKLEKEFPPGFFDSMEHLLIHLTREAILGGPVQYRWMYLYERKLGSLKRTIRNKARVEGSIVESYLVNELSTYCSLYFDPTIETRLNREVHNYAPDIPTSSGIDSRLSIFKVPSRRLFDKGGKSRAFTDNEMHKAHTYILLNCEEVTPLVDIFEDWIRNKEPHVNAEGVERHKEQLFSGWFERHVQKCEDGSLEHLKVLAQGPLRHPRSFKGYFANGYKFHTRTHGDGRVTTNSGICVKGSCWNDYESDFYGLLDEVLEVEYPGTTRCIVVLFKCTWFDTVGGVRVDSKHNLVDVKCKSRLRTDDPFILASQASQVYYAPYPSTIRELKDWWAVVKTKPRGMYEIAGCSTEVADNDNVDGDHFFQEDDIPKFSTSTRMDEDIEPIGLVAPGSPIEVDVNEADEEEDENEDEEEEEEEEFADATDSNEDDIEPFLSDQYMSE